jgi:hypothetical protein
VASTFALTGILSVQGIIAVLLPRKWLRSASAAAQTATACGLMLCLPFIIRASAQGASIERQATWWYAVPPAWFLGLEQKLLGNGDVYFSNLAYIGWMALAFCVLSIGTCYMILFRRFDRIMLRPSFVPSRARQEWLPRLTVSGTLHPAEAAVVEFLVAGLRRSRMHQLVFLGTSSIALAIAIHSLLDVGMIEPWPPLLVIFVAVHALRDTFMLPLEIRASWIFRMTENDAVRPRQLDAVRRVLFALGVVPTVTLFFPVYVFATGVQRAVLWAFLALLIGRVLVDWTLTGWRSIPFTCAYAPGKRHIIFTILLTLSAFVVFVGIGSAALYSATASWPAFLVWLSIFAGAITYASRYRQRTWGRLPLKFDDLPEDIQLLRLSGR